ncbi:hypothetical protein AMST5_04246 [freshwater sediment metagenome]|uniref:Uncharacterized protein n=1 Tax=freshwater sediment metagenome TaxID=556182 RepID=A0AA48M3G2_9ZZZZ
MAELNLVRNNNGRWKWTFNGEGGDSATGYITVKPSTKDAERELVFARLKALFAVMGGAFPPPVTETDES